MATDPAATRTRGVFRRGVCRRAGIPASTLGTYDTRLVDQGFHSIQDNLERVVIERLPQAVEILKCFLKSCAAQRF